MGTRANFSIKDEGMYLQVYRKPDFDSEAVAVDAALSLQVNYALTHFGIFDPAPYDPVPIELHQEVDWLPDKEREKFYIQPEENGERERMNYLAAVGNSKVKDELGEFMFSPHDIWGVEGMKELMFRLRGLKNAFSNMGDVG